MKKLVIIAALMVATLSASAQNTLRENGSFTLQPKVGIDFGSSDNKYRSDLIQITVGYKIDL